MNKLKNKVDYKSLFNKLILVVSIGILANLAFLLLTTEREILTNLTKIKFKYIILIIGLLLIPWLGLACRLMIWTNFLETPVKFKNCFRIAFTTDLGSSITPTLIGGGPLKMALLLKNNVSVAKAGTLTLLNAFEDFIMFCLAFIAAFYFLQDTISAGMSNLIEWVSNNVFTMFFIVAIIILVIFVIKNHLIKVLPIRVQNKLRDVYRALKKGLLEMGQTFRLILREGKTRFLISFSLLICQWLAKLSILIVVLSALGLSFDAFQMYIQQWLVYLSMLFVPTPGATGGAEASFYFIFNGEIDAEYLPLIVSVWRFFTYYMVLFMAIALVQLSSLWE